MTPEQALRAKLNKIEALIAGAATDGERAAADAAADRIRARLGTSIVDDMVIEMKFSITDPWSRQLFIALARRHGLHPFRYRRMHRQSIIVRATERFIDNVLWPQFEELSAALTTYLSDTTDRMIREGLHGDTGEADEVDEPDRIGR